MKKMLMFQLRSRVPTVCLEAFIVIVIVCLCFAVVKMTYIYNVCGARLPALYNLS